MTPKEETYLNRCLVSDYETYLAVECKMEEYVKTSHFRDADTQKRMTDPDRAKYLQRTTIGTLTSYIGQDVDYILNHYSDNDEGIKQFKLELETFEKAEKDYYEAKQKAIYGIIEEILKTVNKACHIVNGDSHSVNVSCVEGNNWNGEIKVQLCSDCGLRLVLADKEVYFESEYVNKEELIPAMDTIVKLYKNERKMHRIANLLRDLSNYKMDYNNHVTKHENKIEDALTEYIIQKGREFRQSKQEWLAQHPVLN